MGDRLDTVSFCFLNVDLSLQYVMTKIIAIRLVVPPSAREALTWILRVTGSAVGGTPADCDGNPGSSPYRCTSFHL